MKKSELARAVAKQNRLKTGDAADQVDRAVTRIIRTLRKGNSARLPGLGTLTPGKTWTFLPDGMLPDGMLPDEMLPDDMLSDEMRPETKAEKADSGNRSDRH